MKQKHCSYLINFIIVNFFFISFICLLSATKPGSDLVSVSEIKHGIQDGLLQISMNGLVGPRLQAEEDQHQPPEPEETGIRIRTRTQTQTEQDQQQPRQRHPFHGKFELVFWPMRSEE